MEQIDVHNYNLLVTSYRREIDSETIWKEIDSLIKQRIEHCKSQLENVVAKGETFLTNHHASQHVVYKNKNGEIYGHFNEPVYNMMVRYINEHSPVTMPILQQALRQYLKNPNSISCDKEYFEGAITEIMLMM